MPRALVRSLVLALLLWQLAASSALAHSGSYEVPFLTPRYLVTLGLGPPGKTVSIDETNAALTAGGDVVLCTTDESVLGSDGFASGIHHLEIHVFNRRNWQMVANADVVVELENMVTGLRATMPVVRMLDPNRGPDDLHYGGDVFTPDGRYRVTVSVNGDRAAFDFVARAGAVEPAPNLGTVLVGRGLWPAFYTGLGLAALLVFVQMARGQWRPADAAGARVLFLALVLFQGVHQLEHVVQVFQAFVLGTRGAAGLLGSAFGLEPVHFAYNAWFLALCGGAFATYGFRRRGEVARPRAVFALLALATVLQSYHVFEHGVKMSQFLPSGINGVPGLLGQHVNAIWLHFALNTLGYVPCLAAWFVGGLHRRAAADARALLAFARPRRLRATTVEG